MASINHWIVEGNLTKAAELSRWSNGTPYCKFTIANNESYKDETGNWVDIPSFFDCVIRGNYAEAMHKHLLKGRWVLVEGRLKQNKWKDENNNNHYAVVLKVENLRFAPGSFQSKDEPQQSGAPHFKPVQKNYEEAESYELFVDENYMDSNIPF